MSEKNDFTNDPRLTAFALGELEGAERAEIEALVAKDENAKRFVEDVRATAALVTTELATAGGPALTAEQRAAIAAKATPAKPVRSMRPVYWIATAASVAAAVVGVSLHRGSDEKETAHATSTRHEETALKDQVTAAGNKAVERETRFGAEEKSTAAAVAHRSEFRATDKRIREKLVRAEDPNTKTEEEQNGPVNPDEVTIPDRIRESGGSGGRATTGAYSQGGGGGGGGQRRAGEVGARADGGKEAGEFNPDPNAPASGATGGTSIGAVRKHPVGHFGGVAANPRGGRMAGPQGEVPADGREPSDPPAPPEADGPATPGGGAGGPTTGGGVADDEAQVRRQRALGLVGGDRGGTTASYHHVEDNPFRLAKDAPLSTFSIDVDTASYSNVRRFLDQGTLPPPGAVRLEEMVNYFPYEYAQPDDGRPFAVRVDVAGCPWKTDHRLVRVGLKGKAVATSARPAANLVFLLDVSGSMSPQNRLPLILQSMKLLVGELDAKDRVAIVVYAGESGVALPSTSCEDKAKILAALGALHAGGSTNGASGIQLAYDIAAQNRVEGGINRVILATDGDFNVGVTDESSLVTLVQERAKTGTYLSVLGVGDDNFKDSTMEMLADKGNGNYAYIDTLKEGQKVLVQQTNGTLVTIAKDVKIQVEFNPAQVGSYRLIGYEDRVLAAEDFRNDKKDAGEIGAGHTVTALYEVVPPGVLATETGGVEPLKYQQPPAPAAGTSRELLTVKLRWKEPNSDVSTPMEVSVVDEGVSYSAASPDFKFAASVAAFGMCLRHSPHKGNINLDAILELATEGAANDPGGYRAEFVGLVKRAKQLGAK